jgi:hypothetical protein
MYKQVLLCMSNEHVRCDQKKGMGLLEYQAMPFSRDVAHDGWLCTFTINQQLEVPSARSWVVPVRATGTVWKRQASRLVHHIQNHTCGVTLLLPARRAAGLGQHSILRPHWVWPCGWALPGLPRGFHLNPEIFTELYGKVGYLFDFS